jgi:hypothetical protein
MFEEAKKDDEKEVESLMQAMSWKITWIPVN